MAPMKAGGSKSRPIAVAPSAVSNGQFKRQVLFLKSGHPSFQKGPVNINRGQYRLVKDLSLSTAAFCQENHVFKRVGPPRCFRKFEKETPA